ncbi:hypothetical protein P152DRAFT_448560 [Eremomyces bilateralis CBS 781.70]|uniref:Rhodopsin domain-containing protein n=1 Tax=Eremomyces bilateralis CBS 781.70 TaxID=1392243 RepID=A0A6G1G5Y2_9PEZI|nr:uncharacterized protein P152DRAFT_448560 [Eremomyces bilateralis CBS 781.70]KAF1813239.1 hypothetical protein P152DRAFT_448560 [Eremomyces bilateralis CBS 781.70]
MRKVPAAVMDRWPAPNFVNPESQANKMLISIYICIIIIIFVLLLRLYSRIYVAKFFGMDDWMIVPAAITAIGYGINAIVAIDHGWYKHIWDLRPHELMMARKLVIASNLTGLYTAGCTKLSVLLLYHRIAPAYSRFQYLVWFFTGLAILWIISFTAANFLLCIPLHAYWDLNYDGPQSCFVEVPYFVAFAGIDLFLDTAIFILPLPLVIPLRLPKRQKMILGAVFGIGIFAVVAAALRLPSLVRVTESFDLTWEIYDAALWTLVEATVGIFCASVPALKPLVQKYTPAILGTMGNGNLTGSGHINSGMYPNSQPAFSRADSRAYSEQAWSRTRSRTLSEPTYSRELSRTQSGNVVFSDIERGKGSGELESVILTRIELAGRVRESTDSSQRLVSPRRMV